MTEHNYSLPKLAFNLNDLEPAISTQIMTLHYTRHHQTYITNLNNALKLQSQALTSNNLIKHLELQQTIKFNAGGHINHTLFWENLQPPQADNSSEKALSRTSPTLLRALCQRYGSLSAFITAFEGVALSLQGSGWVWLVRDLVADSQEQQYLSIVTSKDQDVVPADKIPLLGVDMWEHAYYLQYLNDKKGYLGRVWDVVNWAVVERRFVGRGIEDVFGELGGLVAKM